MTQNVITPESNSALDLRELWRFRELTYFMVWRDIRVRYKQTAFGVAWVVVRPMAMMLIFTLVFGRIAKLPAGDTPYPMMVFAAILPWQYFSNAFNEISNSLSNNAQMLSKIYFPRILLALTGMITQAFDLVITLVIFGLLMVYFSMAPSFNFLYLPILIILTMITTFALAIWFAILNVQYRDFRYIVPFLIQLGLYVSPVGYSAAVIPENYRFFFFLNPMAGIIEGFRVILLGGPSNIDIAGAACSAILVLFALVFGLLYFNKAQRSFADII